MLRVSHASPSRSIRVAGSLQFVPEADGDAILVVGRFHSARRRATTRPPWKTASAADQNGGRSSPTWYPRFATQVGDAGARGVAMASSSFVAVDDAHLVDEVHGVSPRAPRLVVSPRRRGPAGLGWAGRGGGGGAPGPLPSLGSSVGQLSRREGGEDGEGGEDVERLPANATVRPTVQSPRAPPARWGSPERRAAGSHGSPRRPAGGCPSTPPSRSRPVR